MKTQRINWDRLRGLAYFLDRIQEDRFNFSSWVGRDWMGAQDLSCGTTACGLGWATVLWGEKAGVALGHHNMGGGAFPAPIDEIGFLDGNRWPYIYAASERIFGLNDDETERLFVPGVLKFHSSAKDLAAHIRAFIATHEGQSLA